MFHQPSSVPLFVLEPMDIEPEMIIVISSEPSHLVYSREGEAGERNSARRLKCKRIGWKEALEKCSRSLKLDRSR